MTSKRKFRPVISMEDAVSAFIEGARIHHAGAYIQSSQMAIDGLVRTNHGVDFIDAHSPNARDALIPLLNHEEDVVQITAASALIRSHHDLARAVIDRVHANSITEAYGSAVMILTTYDTCGDYVMGLCRPDPRYPVPRPLPEKMTPPR